jgi:hypothetical protein
MMARGIAIKLEIDKELVINRISAPRFNDGGAAILQAEKQNHQKVIDGNRAISPFVTYILRDPVVS